MAGPDPTEAVRDTWEALAPAWEANRERVFDGFRPVSEWLVAEVDPRPGQTVLEVAAGPGETGFLAAERLGSDGRLISTDISPTMVEAARHGAEARGLDNVEARTMDAQHLELDDASVDAIISRLGLMLVPDPSLVFAEARRVLRPDGRLAYAVIGSPMGNQWMGLMMMTFVQHGHVPAGGDPFAPAGPFSLSDHARNRDLLGAAGFEDVEVSEMVGAMPFEDVDDYWALMTRMGGPIPALAAALSADEEAEIRAALDSAMQPYRTDNGYELPSSLVTVSAS